jgi:hypothetical protein
VKEQQMASFNNLTLKGVNKAVANGELEKIKHSFKLSSQEKDRRKEKEKKQYAKEHGMIYDKESKVRCCA